MLKSPLYVRVVTQDRDRGFMLLVGYDSKIVQSTAIQICTLTAITRESLNSVLERVSKDYSASEIRDVTALGIKKRLAKLFGEDAQPTTEAEAA